MNELKLPQAALNETAMRRRRFLQGLTAMSLIPSIMSIQASQTVKPIDAEPKAWRDVLAKERYDVLFKEDTEKPGSSPLNEEKRPGTYCCAACHLPLFASEAKFDSGTGWPSFFQPIDPAHISTKKDFLLIFPRTEYHCARCSGHQGHVFDDGPPPTGLRYCNNGLALIFVPETEELPALRTPG